jgi:hypothetical protein
MRSLPVLLVLIASSRALAGESGEPTGGGAEASPVQVHGFLLGTFTGRTTGVRPTGGDGGDFVLGEERLRFDLGAAGRSGDAILLIKGDLFHDAIGDRFDVDLREAYAGFTKGPIDLRLGRQIVTWGVGDLVFIGDVFPKDWESFFSGRPLEYLKLGVDGMRALGSFAALNAELLVVPFFEPDALPSPAHFAYWNPFSQVPNQRTAKPAPRYSNSELAVRLYRQIAGFDASLVAYRGFWRTPSLRLDDPGAPTTATRFFPDLSVYGWNAQKSLLEGVLSLEAGYYDSRDDRRGVDPAVPNSQWRFLAGYQRQLQRDLTAGLQVYGELLDEYGAYRRTLPAQAPLQDELRWLLTSRLTQFLRYQTWKLGLFVAYSPSDVDYFLQPEISHRLTDEFGVSLGANVFGGRSDTTFFGQFDRDDDVYLGVRFDF